MIERMPTVVGAITLVAGAALIVAPQLATRPLGLEGQEAAMRAIGVSDVVLAPGLLRGEPRWPWMIGRAAVNAVVGGYLHGVASQSSKPALVSGSAAAFAGLTVIDGATGLALR